MLVRKRQQGFNAYAPWSLLHVGTVNQERSTNC